MKIAINARARVIATKFMKGFNKACSVCLSVWVLSSV
jgi:hypothetical protein